MELNLRGQARVHLDRGDEAPVHCNNCDWTGTVKDTNGIKDAHERLCPGEEIPAGECPECGAMAYIADEAKPDWMRPPALVEATRTWKCAGCGRTVQLTPDDMAEIGNPICTNEDCDRFDEEMELQEAGPPSARYGWGWIDGEDDREGDHWIQISELDEDGNLGDELAVIMLRNAEESERKFPGITRQRERAARMIVGALNGKAVDFHARLIVSMHGCTIQEIYCDNDRIEITDVVFTEYPSYLDGDDDRDDDGNLRFGIDGGPLDGEGIYTHHGGVKYAGEEVFGPVMDAARRRIDAAEEEDRQDDHGDN